MAEPETTASVENTEKDTVPDDAKENSSSSTTEPENVEVSPELESKIIQQIEYYFGDMNLTKDRFLKEKIKEDDGWVTVETLLRFNRLKKMTEVPGVVVAAMRKATSGLVEIKADGSSLRRSTDKPLPDDTKERREEISLRTIYAKEFPLDSTLDELKQFFETYGPVETVFMKKNFHQKTFKGSVFCTFLNKDDASKFIGEEETKFKEAKVEIKKLRPDYFQDKQKKKEKSKGQKTKGKENNTEKKEAKEEITEEDEEEKARTQMTKNALLRLTKMDATTSREDVRNHFSDFAEVGWVDFDKGVTEGYIRLREANSAPLVLEKAKAAGDGKVMINNKEVEVSLVEGDEELEYWKKMFKDLAARNERKKKFNRERGGRNQRGRGRNRGGPQGKRRHDNTSNEEPETKTAKTEDS